MIIKVTKKDIKEGVQKDCYNCAIAKGLKKYFKNKFVSVGADTIFIDQKVYKTTVKMYDFIQKFDENKSTCKPESFRLIKAK